MLRKTIEYTDYNGVDRKETFYFNLTKSELTKMEIGTVGGYAEMIQRIVDAKEGHEIVKAFEDLIFKSYCVKSDDGKRLIKNAKLSEEFSQTPAYDVLFMELATDADAAAAFVNGIMPEDIDRTALIAANTN